MAVTLSGKFTRVSSTEYTNKKLIGFCGDVYPHDLDAFNIDYIKLFYNCKGWKHRIYTEWPEDIKPAFPSYKKNYINGFLLLEKED